VARSGVSALLREPVVRRRAWIILAAVLVCGYAAGVLGYVLATPEIGVRTAFTPVANHFYEEFLYPEGQPPLRAGDRIVKIGDQPVENWSQLLRKIMQLRDEPAAVIDGLTATDVARGRVPPNTTFIHLDGQRVVRLVYERPGEEARRVVWCRLGRSPLETLVPSVLWFFLKIGLFVVGAIVFWQRPEDRSAAQFFWLVIVSFGAYLGGYHWWRIVTQPVLLLLFMVCGLLLPAVTLHFYLVFPRPKAFFERNPRTVLLAVYGPPVGFLLLLLSGYLRVQWLQASGHVAGVAGGLTSGLGDGLDRTAGGDAGVRLLLVEILYEIFLYFGVAALWYLASVASLVHSYGTAANDTERNQVKWILYGAAAAVVPIGYSLYLAFWETGRFGGGAATWPMFAASVCVTAAYTVSITRYKLMQLDQLISSGAIYFLISFLAGGLYYGLVFAGVALVGSQVGEGPSFGQVLAVSTTALVLTAALDLIRGRFKRVLDRHFRREKYQLDRTLQRMSRAIEQLVDPPTLARRLLQTAGELLSVSRGAVYLRQGAPPLYHLTDALGPAPALTELSSGCPLVEALLAQGTLRPHTVSGPGNGAGGPALRQLHFVGGEVAQGLLHEGQLLGILVLGAKEGGAYTSEEVNLLSAFAQITVLALVSAEGHRTIDVLNRDLKDKVEKIAEQQRRILALQSQLLSQRRKQEEKAPANEEEAATAEPAEVGAGERAASPLPDGMVGSSPQVQQLMSLVRRVAASSSAVLLRGESGTGKELLARALHENSPRADRPFVKVHCAALSQGLLESELFGHVKGAFTSAIRDKVGRFESAHGGTLFLDEIGDINLEVQTKLLRVLEEMTFERVGSSEPVRVDVRIIAATHRNLEAMIQSGRFREDLFFRLNVLPITLPPLRERIEDVSEMAMHFLRIYAQRANKAVTSIDDDVLALLKAYHWPGNVRQLENVIERAVVIAEGPVITVAELPPELSEVGRTEGENGQEGSAVAEANGTNGAAAWAGNGAVTLAELASAIQADRTEHDKREREHLVRALAAASGNKAEAARALGLARSTLVSKLKKHGLS
jgi:transcriptional regulator with GAF, ATPase, and Fis domain